MILKQITTFLHAFHVLKVILSYPYFLGKKKNVKKNENGLILLFL